MRQGAPRRGLTSPAQGSLSWPRLYPKHKTETFLKREKSSEDSPGDMSVCASISCMRFLYSIFLAIVVSLFAEGWERPSVSGTHPLSHCHSVPCVPCLRSPTATSMLLVGAPLTAFLQVVLPSSCSLLGGTCARLCVSHC